MAIGDASYTITPDNNLEISDYIYNHSNKPQTVALQVKNDNKVVKEEPFIIEPSVRNEYIHVLTEVSNGLCDISMQIEGLKHQLTQVCSLLLISKITGSSIEGMIWPGRNRM